MEEFVDDGDPGDWDGDGHQELRRHLKNLEASLRCPVCQSFLKASVTLPCGHGFCSGCIRSCLETNTEECPVCKANKAPQFSRPLGVVRVDRPLNDSVSAFTALRSKLLDLLKKGGGQRENGDDDEVSVVAVNHSSSGGRKRARQRSGRFLGEEDEEEQDGSDGSSSISSNGGGGGSRTKRSSVIVLGDTPWYEATEGITKINYHHANDAMIRKQVAVMGLSTFGNKERLVFRHQQYMKELEVAKDQARLDPQQVKSRREVIREITQLERHRDEEASRGTKKLKVGDKLPAYREKFFDYLKEQVQRRRASKVSPSSSSTAAIADPSAASSSSSAGWEGGGRRRESDGSHDSSGAPNGGKEDNGGERSREEDDEGDFSFNVEREERIHAACIISKVYEAKDGGSLQGPSPPPAASNSCPPTHSKRSPPSSSSSSSSPGAATAATAQGSCAPQSRKQPPGSDGSVEQQDVATKGRVFWNGLEIVDLVEDDDDDGGAGEEEGWLRRDAGKGEQGGVKEEEPRRAGGGGGDENIHLNGRQPGEEEGGNNNSSKQEETWQCRHCTYLNPAGQEACDVCGAHPRKSTEWLVQGDQRRILEEARKSQSPRTLVSGR